MGRIKRFFEMSKKKINSKEISIADYDKMVFGQVNYGSKNYFSQELGQCHTIALQDFPHYDFICNHLNAPLNNHKYNRYLKSSWDYLYGENHNHSSETKIKNYISLHGYTANRIKNGKIPFAEPLELCQRPDGKLIIVNGNHRAAIGKALNIPAKAYYHKPEDYLKTIATVPDVFYGSARMGLPYQSIFDGNKELVRGRRSDIKERIDLIAKDDLHNKTILELGCNIGCNCFAALQAGARSAVGIDIPALIGVALRLNCYFALPCDFISFDLNNESDTIEPADIMFCFSVYRHIENKQALINTMLNKTKKILFFEGHGNTTLTHYESFLNKDNFKSIELIGHTRNGIHTQKRNRPLYRCEIAR